MVTVPALIGGIALIAVAIVVSLRTVRRRDIACLPLSATQELDLREPGPIAFLLERPRYQNRRATRLQPFGLTVRLEDSRGRTMQAASVRVPLSIKSVRRVRTEFAILTEVPPGHYRVHLSGLASGADLADAFLLLARPISRLTFVAGIIAIVASSGLAVGGLIASVATFLPFRSG
jgi:hypothetical protein